MPAQRAAHGSWKSPITAPLITATGVALSELWVSGDDVYWREGRPLEQGRGVVVRARMRALESQQELGAGQPLSPVREDVTPAGHDVRTRVHEYGGGSYLVHDRTVFFSSCADQRLHCQDPGQAPRPITPAPEIAAGLRYADGRATADGRLIVCVRERHVADREPFNEIAAIPADGAGAPRVIVVGRDFYAAPRVSPDGARLAWLCWDHPCMPWDGTELWVGRLHADGAVTDAERIAGGATESILQPEWAPDGTLYFISDRTGWWNLYQARDRGARDRAGAWSIAPLVPMEAEIGAPLWGLGMSRYALLDHGRIACIYSRDGVERLGILAPGAATVMPLDLPYTAFGSLCSDGAHGLACVAASATEAAAVVAIDGDTGSHRVLKRSLDLAIDPGYLATPEHVEFPTAGDRTAYALVYMPANRDFTGPEGERPPLIVMSHGGPTAATSSALSLRIQFWTSRGFAVADVNYGGSSGYGRDYRERLRGQWGIVDTADCVAVARHLADTGRVDGKRMAIRGGSAGGYTTLCALVFHDVFAAGASYYGVADLEALARETHKFEARYLDGLVGPYPARADVYRERSPIHFLDRLSCPVILFQGLEDRVVPPGQAEAMIAALEEKRLPYAYLPFPGEQHGFRKAENIERSIEAELFFYARFFGFAPADEIAPVTIAHAPGPAR
jgi:dipeptidyl aminopeptidase/acylaminoacyl peptidase